MFNRIDRESFDIALHSKDEVINCLEQQIVRLEQELEMQRRRADLAIDRLLSLKSIPTVMPENIVFPKDKPEDVTQVGKAIEALKSELESIGEISEGEDDPTVVEEVA